MCACDSGVKTVVGDKNHLSLSVQSHINSFGISSLIPWNCYHTFYAFCFGVCCLCCSGVAFVCCRRARGSSLCYWFHLPGFVTQWCIYYPIIFASNQPILWHHKHTNWKLHSGMRPASSKAINQPHQQINWWIRRVCESTPEVCRWHNRTREWWSEGERES